MFVQTGNHYGAAPAPCKEPLAAHILAAPRFIACVLAAPCPCRPRPCCTTHQPLASSSDAHAKNTVSPTRWPHLGQPPLCRLALNSMTDTEGPPTLFCISAGTDHQHRQLHIASADTSAAKSKLPIAVATSMRAGAIGRDAHGPWSR